MSSLLSSPVSRRFSLVAAWITLVAPWLAPAQAALRLPTLFSDHLVLQAGQKDAVWGWADPGTKITATVLDAGGATAATASTTTGSDGRWMLHLPPLTPKTAGQLKISTDHGESKTLADVLVGQDWLAGGQSNMTYHVESPNTPPNLLALAKKEAADAQGVIRYFQVSEKGVSEPQDDVPGKWIVGSPDTVGGCSAVAWYFGVRLHDKLGQPIGLLNSNVGGTPAEAWIAPADFKAMTCAAAIDKRTADRLAAYPKQMAEYPAALAAWKKQHPSAAEQKELVNLMPKPPQGPGGRATPSYLYNGMIHGLQPYTLAGIIWYQADGNSGHPEEYPELIQTLIKSWRRDFQSELPFYYVEMNNMWPLQTAPVDNIRGDPAIREAQEAALALPKTDVVAAIDLGDKGAITNPHYWNKVPVGDRLANEALEQVYGMPLGEVHSPAFASFAVEGNKVRLKFDHAEGLRTRGGGAVKGFVIRGASGDWAWAQGRIDGNDVVVWSDQVPQPTAVRYAWAANPVISIENGAGLPLRPFRTDKNAKP
jgi:sialate O-acetylesterase